MAIIPQNPLSSASFRRQNQQIQTMGQFLEKPVIPKYDPPPPRYINTGGTPSYSSTTTGGDDLIVRLMHAIAGKESGSRYNAVNPDSGALGKYQIMPFNLANWAKAAGIPTPTRQQFLADPNMQELMARTQFQQALSRYGNDPGQVAAWWYGGEGGRKAYVAGRGRNKEAGGYPSIQEYVAAILAAMGMS